MSPQTETKDEERSLGDASLRTLQRTGYALVGLGAYIGDGIKTLAQRPEVVGELGEALHDGLVQLTHRGEEAWPTIVENSRRAATKVQHGAEDVGRTVRWRLQLEAAHAPDLEERTVDELRELARELDIEGRSDMTKDELIASIRGQVTPDYAELTVEELRELARAADIHGRSNMNKDELVTALEEHDAGER